MRKLIVLSFITLDGVMQAPGAPEEDTAGGFKFGGWSVKYFDDFLGKVMADQMGRDFDLVLGRKTYEIFAAYWPFADTSKDPIAAGINKAAKYVVSKSPLKLEWSGSVLLNDAVDGIRELKAGDGPDLQVHGSGNLVQTLLKHDLVDELWLKIFPITLGSGKRLFAEGAITAGFDLVDSQASPSGVIVASYKRDGDVQTGSFVLEEPKA